MAAFHHDDMNDKAVQPPPSDKNNDEPIGRLPNRVVMITAIRQAYNHASVTEVRVCVLWEKPLVLVFPLLVCKYV